MTKDTRIKSGVVSSINGVGKTGQIHVENETRPLSDIIYKNKLKMD